MADDRGTLEPGARVLLIVEDDVRFARILVDVAHELGFLALVAAEGSAGLALATKYRPSAVVLDLHLPDIDGFVVLDRLKHSPTTRHIPVAVFSADAAPWRALRMGALSFVAKPVGIDAVRGALLELQAIAEEHPKRLLIVEDDPIERQAIAELVGSDDVEIVTVESGTAALEELERAQYRCMVVDLGLPDLSGFELLSRIKQRPEHERLPVVVYTGLELSKSEETELRRLAESIIVKDVRSPERLLSEVSLFLHRAEEQLPPLQKKLLDDLHRTAQDLEGRKIVVVDDDVRNIFAITSALERHGARVGYAENGRDGLALLERESDVDAVLMDVMMPEMDGYEVIRRIRTEKRFAQLPIIAVTAKAMRADREKCIQAGANEYIAKPVDLEHLLSLLRVALAP